MMGVNIGVASLNSTLYKNITADKHIDKNLLNTCDHGKIAYLYNSSEKCLTHPWDF